MTVFIPLRTQTESNTGGHWSVKAARAKLQRTTTYGYLFAEQYSQNPPHTYAPPLLISLTRIAPRQLDQDNLISSVKHCVDGIADWLKIDDRDPRLRWRYDQASRGSTVYGVEITIEEA